MTAALSWLTADQHYSWLSGADRAVLDEAISRGLEATFYALDSLAEELAATGHETLAEWAETARDRVDAQLADLPPGDPAP